MQPLPPPPNPNPESSTSGNISLSRPGNHRPKFALVTGEDQAEASRNASTFSNPAKKRRHRGGKKRRNRRQSFAAPPSETSAVASNMDNVLGDDDDDSHSPIRPGDSFYRRKTNRSDDSLDSDALLDHRNQTPMRPRRESRLNVQAMQRAGIAGSFNRQRSHDSRNHHRRRTGSRPEDDDLDAPDPTDRTPLMSSSKELRSPGPQSGYGMFRSDTRGSSPSSMSKKRTKSNNIGSSFPKFSETPGYNVNNPPSVPSSPHLGASSDPMMPDTSFLNRSPESYRNLKSKANGDALIDIDKQNIVEGQSNSAPPSPRLGPDGTRHRRATIFGPDTDVCFPAETMSEMGEEEFDRIGSRGEVSSARPRRRKREWPQIWALEEWAREEQEDKAADERRMQRIYEPVMVEGRLRPSRPSAWHRDLEAAPMRYTYFSEEYDSTIHAPTISELVPEGGNFRDLFIPEPPVIEESSSSESDDDIAMPPLSDLAKPAGMVSPKQHGENGSDHLSRLSTISSTLHHKRSVSQQPARIDSILTESLTPSPRDQSKARSADNSGERTPQPNGRSKKKEKPRKYGPRPTFWLDVMSPTDSEMTVLQKAFGIHPLTREDIMLQEAREKVELFKNYYFINYRTFEQDTESEDYLEPINVYVIVFRYGILTFHFSQIPHPANVRRRIRQLQDYLILSADWISYAMIDDITDAYVPMIHGIEEEVDDIDEAILQSTPGAFALTKEATGDEKSKKERGEKESSKDDTSSVFSFSLPFGKNDNEKKDTSGYDMLRRVGGTRKKVMSLYRLLGTKADVIKGFAKRCNEQWDVAPKTEIGLYLGDIQDHILTMTSNLSHYETLLSRAHSNYLAQVSIRMNERSEQTGDILNKLTVFGTIVLPMNIICGMWGMNVKVPGQDIDNLWWFWGITGFLVAFALGCYLLCKKLYGIV